MFAMAGVLTEEREQGSKSAIVFSGGLLPQVLFVTLNVY